MSEIYDAPVLLFYKGNLDLLKFPKVAACVGSRACSKQELSQLKKLFKAWKMNWLSSVDWPKALIQQPHMASLQNGGKTIAVIGTGLDVFYPKANKRLQDYIGNDHLVLSEYGPGEQPL